MKVKTIVAGIIACTCAASSVLASISLDFSQFGLTPITGTNNAGGVIGEQYRVTNVANLGGVGGIFAIDAIFEITDASVDDENKIAFVNETKRGDDARIRFEKSADESLIWAKVSISFVQSLTTTSVDVAQVTGSNLRIQFDDLDSDLDSDRADFAGLETSQIDLTERAANTELIIDTTLSAGYTVGLFPVDPTTMNYDPQINISSIDPVDQSPVTIAFDTSVATINLVLGVTGPDSGSRHIDIDGTPDFIIVPEPSSSVLLVGAVVFGLVSLRRRR